MKSDLNVLFLFGERVRDLRKKKNISQEELAHLSGLHRTYIGMIERAEKNITLKNIEKGIASLSLNYGQGNNMNQSSNYGNFDNFGIGSFFPPYGGMYG